MKYKKEKESGRMSEKEADRQTCRHMHSYIQINKQTAAPTENAKVDTEIGVLVPDKVRLNTNQPQFTFKKKLEN